MVVVIVVSWFGLYNCNDTEGTGMVSKQELKALLLCVAAFFAGCYVVLCWM